MSASTISPAPLIKLLPPMLTYFVNKCKLLTLIFINQHRFLSCIILLHILGWIAYSFANESIRTIPAIFVLLTSWGIIFISPACLLLENRDVRFIRYYTLILFGHTFTHPALFLYFKYNINTLFMHAIGAAATIVVCLAALYLNKSPAAKNPIIPPKKEPAKLEDTLNRLTHEEQLLLLTTPSHKLKEKLASTLAINGQISYHELLKELAKPTEPTKHTESTH